MAYWVAEISAVNPADDSTVTWRFALGRGRAPSDVGHIAGDLKRWASPTQKIDVGEGGVIRSTADEGELVVMNRPESVAETGTYDDGTTYAWQNRTAYLYQVPGAVWADRVLWARAIVEQPVADMSTLRFRLRDPRAELDAPLQTTSYAGDNVAPDGVEGAEDLKGKPKPIIYGVVSNVPLDDDCVNEQKLIYQVADKEVTLLCVRDGGVPLSAGTSRANVASLQANTPPQGSYDYVSGSGGTYIRVSAPPVYGLKVDAQEGATEADRTHAQIWKRIRTERCATDSGDIDDTTVDAVDVLDDHETGFHAEAGESRRAFLDRVLGSLVGFEVQDLTGAWRIGRLDAPSGTPAFKLVQALGIDFQSDDERPMITLERVRPGWEPDGSPPYRVNGRWGRNHSVMDRTAFAGSASERLKQKFSQEWRVEFTADATIWDPDTNGGYFPGAPELTFDFGYQPGADNRTCPHAATRTSELLTLFSGLKGQYLTEFLPDAADNVLPGAVVQAKHPRFGMDTEPLFLVLYSRFLVEAGEDPEVELLIGLQT